MINNKLERETCAQCAKEMGAYADSLCDSLKERVNELLHCLENDWHIRASWDGLRKFWNIELTEEGVRMRDAELMIEMCHMEKLERFDGSDPSYRCDACGHENYEFELPRYCPSCRREVEQ